MSDIGVPTNWLVSKDIEVERKWIDVQIQERKSRIVKTRQDIEDLERGMKVKLEAVVMMLEKEIAFLEQKKATLTMDKIVDAEVNE
jgi:hypothetical protein